MDGGLPVKITQGYPLNPCVDSEDAGPFPVAIANAFFIVGNLARIQAAIVTEIAAITVYLRFPLHPGSRGEIGDVELMATRFEFTEIGTESAHGPIHDIAGNSLHAAQEVGIVFPIQGAVVGSPIADIRVVKPLGDIGEIVGIVLEGFPDGNVGIRCRTVLRHVEPTGTEIIVPLTPCHPILVVGGVQLHGQPLLAQVIDTGSPLGVRFHLADGRQQQRRQNGDNGHHDQEFD